MSLIDSTYFVGDIYLPDTTYSDLTTFITKYEREYLLRVLGYDLYKLVAAYNSGTSPQVIKDIVEGKEYTVDANHTVKWEGLKNTLLLTPIAYYVYYRFVEANHSMLMPTGNMAAAGENATRYSPAERLAQVWHRCRELTGYAGQDALAPSLYNFMVEHLESYDETPYYWEFTDIGHVNAFDL